MKRVAVCEWDPGAGEDPCHAAVQPHWRVVYELGTPASLVFLNAADVLADHKRALREMAVAIENAETSIRAALARNARNLA